MAVYAEQMQILIIVGSTKFKWDDVVYFSSTDSYSTFLTDVLISKPNTSTLLNSSFASKAGISNNLPDSSISSLASLARIELPCVFYG